MTKQLATDMTNSSAVGQATGFELATPDRPRKENIESALERSRAFAAAGHHPGATVFPSLRHSAITRLDPRVDRAGTVAADVERLRAAPAVPARIAVSGHVYDVVTGLVETVIAAGR